MSVARQHRHPHTQPIQSTTRQYHARLPFFRPHYTPQKAA
ncbi:hypothetical protein GCWU000324_00510 [Kingella oralis ATCC 51147]|uniref:Uncharacterized protein n=1 Tax=Kingella oralis ATCC 51147 TaxID=629741 RepID=C4GI19_9NEIS|nr:hypothetical protein GCWU000324_00510 [Kingella oralis ATCC 51147]